MHALAHLDGELATSRAASKAGVPMILSHYSNFTVEDVVRAGEDCNTVYGMQLSVVNDWEANMQVVRRAEGQSPTVTLAHG